MASKLEELLNATINGDTVDFTPQSRMEEYLKACINGTGTEGLPTPQSRSDALFMQLAEKMAGGGGGGSNMEIRPLIITESGTYDCTKLAWSPETKATFKDVIDPARFANAIGQPFESTGETDVTPSCVVAWMSDTLAYISVKLDNGVQAVYLTVDMINGLGLPVSQEGWFDMSTLSAYSEPVTCPIADLIALATSIEEFNEFFVEDFYSISSRFNGGYNPVEVKIGGTLKQRLAATDNSARMLFYGQDTMVECTSCIAYEDTENVHTMENMFCNCKALREVPLFDTRNVTTMYGMFYGCYKLNTVPLFDTRNVLDMGRMFDDCYDLVEVPALDMRRVYNPSRPAYTDYMFRNCKQLTNCWVKNIRMRLQVGSGTTYGHKLTVESLTHLVKELCANSSGTKVLTVGSANLEKLANVYVRQIEITDEMRAEDDLIDEKLPFEVCESTDEGAVLITEYVTYKNWEIQ